MIIKKLGKQIKKKCKELKEKTDSTNRPEVGGKKLEFSNFFLYRLTKTELKRLCSLQKRNVEFSL